MGISFFFLSTFGYAKKTEASIVKIFYRQFVDYVLMRQNQEEEEIIREREEASKKMVMKKKTNSDAGNSEARKLAKLKGALLVCYLSKI